MALDYRTYEEALQKFRWRERWKLFDGSKEKFNIAHECIDRHPKGDIAIRIKFSDRTTREYTFGEFSQLTSRFANFLEGLGIGAGESVAIMLFPSIEFYTSMFGTFKRGSVAVPCFPLFGSEAVSFRLEKSKAKAIVTAREMMHLVDEKLAARLGLKVITSDDLLERLGREEDRYDWNTTADTVCMIQFSSGTTGSPKSVMYRHGAISVAAVVMKFGIGLRPQDTYFCPSSPGWGHGIWYGTIAPLIFGKAIGTISGRFDPEVCLEALEEFDVTKMAAISSHYRLIMESGKADRFKLKLRTVCYTGEPMSKELIERMKLTWGLLPYAQYGTTEVGPITLDYAGFEDWRIKPGSIGKPMIGGLKVAVLDEEGHELQPGKIGQIAIWRDGRWVRMGDSAYMDEDGYFWYVSRTDDVIISAGYTIGPIEVEEVLQKHYAVDECAVIGSPDRERGSIVKAFIKLKAGYEPSEKLNKEIQDFVKNRLSKHEYPREIEFIQEIPKTPDGKIKRKELKDREMQTKLTSG